MGACMQFADGSQFRGTRNVDDVRVVAGAAVLLATGAGLGATAIPITAGGRFIAAVHAAPVHLGKVTEPITAKRLQVEIRKARSRRGVFLESLRWVFDSTTSREGVSKKECQERCSQFFEVSALIHDQQPRKALFRRVR